MRHRVVVLGGGGARYSATTLEEGLKTVEELAKRFKVRCEIYRKKRTKTAWWVFHVSKS